MFYIILYTYIAFIFINIGCTIVYNTLLVKRLKILNTKANIKEINTLSIESIITNAIFSFVLTPNILIGILKEVMCIYLIKFNLYDYVNHNYDKILLHNDKISINEDFSSLSKDFINFIVDENVSVDMLKKSSRFNSYIKRLRSLNEEINKL